jgi:guanosine monophosphate reductase
MKIYENIHLDYSDVLLKPSNSSIYSRKDVDLIKKINFPISKQSWEGVPIIAANMDTVGTYEVYKVLSQYKMITCLHKFYNVEDLKEMDLDPNYFMISTGINDNDLERLDNIIQDIEVKFICVDVANGYMNKLIEFCSNLRKKYPNKIIVAGNVVCSERTKELIKYGKVDIVKVGIGSGCFDENTQILMSNGTYKNIIDINEGDKVINKEGKSVIVLQKIYKGKKKVIEINNQSYNKNTIVTPDHKYWIGNLSELSNNTVKKTSTVKLLDRNDIKTRFKWNEISNIDIEKQFSLLPKNIEWDLPESIKLDLCKFMNKNTTFDNNYIYIGENKYNRFLDLDKKMGNIIGNYLYNINSIQNLRNYIDNFKLTHILNTHDSLIKNFLTSLSLKFPIIYYNKNIEFIKGLYIGLLNTNDEEFKKDKHYYTVIPQLNELFYFCVLSLGFNFKFSKKNKMIIVDKKASTKKYLINKFKNINNEEKIVDTYDLEIDNECHSFIANHSIVHNSACLTRTQTGIGVPQLSAVNDCANGAHDYNSYIIGDGGITCAGDISKGLGAGADFIMLGGLLGGHDENPGEIIEENNKKFKIFYGMSSKTSMEKNYGKMDNYRSSEGRTCKIPYKGKIENTIEDLLGGVRSTCTYVGAKNIEELPEKSIFIRVNNQLNKMYEKY